LRCRGELWPAFKRAVGEHGEHGGRRRRVVKCSILGKSLK
jgi:hypothetical protein